MVGNRSAFIILVKIIEAMTKRGEKYLEFMHYHNDFVHMNRS